MQIELDISLANPLDEIDLYSIYRIINTNKKYIISNYQDDNFMVIVSEDHIRIRIHQDGRAYIKLDTKNGEYSDIYYLLEHLVNMLSRFFSDLKMIDKYSWSTEFNFSFSGSQSNGFFWNNFFRIKEFGKKILNCNTMRLYSPDNKYIYVKLVS